MRQYVKQQGSYWIKTNENTGWWIKFEGGYYATITNGSTSQLVPKYLIIHQQEKQNHYHHQQQNQQNKKHQELQELQLQEFQQQQNQPNQDGPGNSFTELERVNELERNEPQRERKSQVKCEKCGLEGSYVKRKVKSHYYLYIRHKTNEKIKECLISRLT